MDKYFIFIIFVSRQCPADPVGYLMHAFICFGPLSHSALVEDGIMHLMMSSEKPELFQTETRILQPAPDLVASSARNDTSPGSSLYCTLFAPFQVHLSPLLWSTQPLCPSCVLSISINVMWPAAISRCCYKHAPVGAPDRLGRPDHSSVRGQQLERSLRYTEPLFASPATRWFVIIIIAIHLPPQGQRSRRSSRAKSFFSV